MRFLVAESETPTEQETRRHGAGSSSAESYADTLGELRPGAAIEIASCIVEDAASGVDLSLYDAVFFSGSPLQMQDESSEARSAARFMGAVFEAGVPAFGSCAGLQIAAVAAGGRCRERQPRMEAAFARRITATDAGRDHPLLAGRPAVWDAPAMHGSEVADIPPGATILAHTRTTPVQAIEIRHANGVFWGVQYHPELTLGEISASLVREAGDLVDDGLAESEDAVRVYAGYIDALHRDPERRDLAWQLGLDDEVLRPVRRTTELRNALDMMSRR